MEKIKKSFLKLFGIILLIVSCSPPPSEGEGSLLGVVGPFLPFALIILLFYFLIIRPQRKQQKTRDSMLKSLRKGDSLVTNGGILGKIVDIHDDILVLEISKGVNIKIKREFINSISDSDNKKNKS